MKKYAILFLTAISGHAIINSPEARAELTGLANKEIICRRINKEDPPPEQPERLKINSCQTMVYPLAPLAIPAVDPVPEPIPPYSS